MAPFFRLASASLVLYESGTRVRFLHSYSSWDSSSSYSGCRVYIYTSTCPIARLVSSVCPEQTWMHLAFWCCLLSPPLILTAFIYLNLSFEVHSRWVVSIGLSPAVPFFHISHDLVLPSDSCRTLPSTQKSFWSQKYLCYFSKCYTAW